MTTAKQEQTNLSQYLEATPILDYETPTLRALGANRQWSGLAEYERIGAIYDFVRNEVLFGYNHSDDIPASLVLKDGYGQCNTKGSLLMALLRLHGIPCRFHGFTIHKALQKGAITGLWYQLAPESIIHSWVEVLHEGRWLNLEGFILDSAYLDSIQCMFPQAESFCGYGAAVPDLSQPQVEWAGGDTYIQKDGINSDLGTFDSPDDFYTTHGSNLRGPKKFLYAHVVRRLMNRNVARIRRKAPGSRQIDHSIDLIRGS